MNGSDDINSFVAFLGSLGFDREKKIKLRSIYEMSWKAVQRWRQLYFQGLSLNKQKSLKKLRIRRQISWKFSTFFVTLAHMACTQFFSKNDKTQATRPHKVCNLWKNSAFGIYFWTSGAKLKHFEVFWSTFSFEPAAKSSLDLYNSFFTTANRFFSLLCWLRWFD